MGACASRPPFVVVADADHRSVLRDETLLAPRGTHSYDGYVDPVDLATQMKSFRRQVQRKSLAPFWPPIVRDDDDSDDDDSDEEAGESCPICACRYKSVNVTTCCQFKICSECHARHVNSFAFGEKGAFDEARRRQNRYNRNIRIFTRRNADATTTTNTTTTARTARKRRRMMKPTCVCCRKEGYTVMYLGVRTKKERERDAEEKRRIDTSLARAKLGIDEETRRRQSLFSSAARDEGKEEEQSTVVAIPKGWEKEYEMARLAEEGGSPRAREDAAAFEERNFSRGALNERNSSSFMSTMPSHQRTSFLRGRSEMFAEMYDALFHEEGNTRRSRRSFDLGSRRNLPDFRRNSEDFFENGALPPLNESGDDTATTTADNSTQHSQQQQLLLQRRHSRRLVQEFRNMVLEELYLSEALYRSMLDVHEDGEHVQNRINSLREGDENNSETEEASDAEEGEYDENRVEVVAEEEEEEEEEGATTRDASSDDDDNDDNDK